MSNRPATFLSEAALGFVLSVAAAALATSALFVLPFGTTLRAVVALLGLAYVLLRLARSPERIGRAVVVGLWSLVAGLSWLFVEPLAAYIAIHVAMVWLIRSLYTYSSLLSAAADLLLSVLSLAVAVWVLARGESVFLASWCFFLLQALHVAIPRERKLPATPESGAAGDEFSKAHRAAEAALRRMTIRH